MIAIERLEVRYGSRRALRDVDLVVPCGSSVAVVGPNGSGKSTLLAAVAGAVRAHAGSVWVDDPRPALVLQATEVDESLPITVRETVSLARYTHLGLFRRFRTVDHDAVERAMDRLAISDLADRQLHDLSGGQRQRTLVAQGLAQESRLLLLDEPSSSLDARSRHIIRAIIDDEVANGRTLVLATHDLDDAAACDRVLLLDTTPIAYGTPSSALSEHHLRSAFGDRAGWFDHARTDESRLRVAHSNSVVR